MYFRKKLGYQASRYAVNKYFVKLNKRISNSQNSLKLAKLISFEELMKMYYSFQQTQNRFCKQYIGLRLSKTIAHEPINHSQTRQPIFSLQVSRCRLKMHESPYSVY